MRTAAWNLESVSAAEPQPLYADANPRLRMLRLFSLRLLFVYLLSGIWMWLDELAAKQTFLIRKPYSFVARLVVPWVGHHLFRIQGSIVPHNVHDTVFFYLQTLCLIVFSLLAAGIWCFYERQGRYDPMLFDLLRVLLRYSLAYIMTLYAFRKIGGDQFPFPDLMRLTDQYGDSSPMGLMWTFVGYSRPYSLFGAFGEMAGSVLLLFRHTTMLGALILGAVVANITAMDFAYDVSVKLFCLNLMLMIFAVLLPDIERLFHFFVLNQSASSPGHEDFPRSRRFRLWKNIAKTAVILLLIVRPAAKILRDDHPWRQNAKPPYYGLYKVEEFTMDGKAYLPLLSGNDRWRFVAIGSFTTFQVKRTDNSVTEYPMIYDSKERRIWLRSPEDQTAQGSLVVSQVRPGVLWLTGELKDRSLQLRLRRVDESKFMLTSRGFHWINESSFFR